MKHRSNFEVLYAPEVSKHVASIDRKHYPAIKKAVEEQLQLAPDEQTRNRKPLTRQPGPFGATWELRCGPGNRFRAFYAVDRDQRQVWILAIGVKERSRLLIGGEEFGP